MNDRAIKRAINGFLRACVFALSSAQGLSESRLVSCSRDAATD